MNYVDIKEPIKIVGVEITTTNDGGKAFHEIPAQWHNVFESKILDKVPNKISDDIYTVYTNFQNEGKNNKGTYSFVIGVPVSIFSQMPAVCMAVEIPATKYQIFEVEKGRPDKVGEKWQEIWKHNFERKQTFKLEFEKYAKDGAISIFIGVE